MKTIIDSDAIEAMNLEGLIALKVRLVNLKGRLEGDLAPDKEQESYMRKLFRLKPEDLTLGTIKECLERTKKRIKSIEEE